MNEGGQPPGEEGPSRPDDDSLVRRAQEGDQDALGTLYRRYVAEIYRYAYRRVGNREEAEDLTSQIFLQMVRSIGGYRPQGYFRAWLYGIARKVIVDWWRAYYRAPTIPLEKFLDLEPAPLADPPAADTRSEETVERLLGQLPERQREVLSLRFLRGYSLEETAQAMGVSLANAKVLQHRALKKAAQLDDPQKVLRLSGDPSVRPADRGDPQANRQDLPGVS